MKKEEVIDIINVKFKDGFSNNAVIMESGPHGNRKYLKKYLDKKAKTVIVPYYINAILSKAFKGCKSLVEINLPKRCKVDKKGLPTNCKITRFATESDKPKDNKEYDFKIKEKKARKFSYRTENYFPQMQSFPTA